MGHGSSFGTDRGAHPPPTGCPPRRARPGASAVQAPGSRARGFRAGAEPGSAEPGAASGARTTGQPGAAGWAWTCRGGANPYRTGCFRPAWWMRYGLTTGKAWILGANPYRTPRGARIQVVRYGLAPPPRHDPPPSPPEPTPKAGRSGTGRGGYAGPRSARNLATSLSCQSETGARRPMKNRSTLGSSTKFRPPTRWRFS